MDLHSLTYGYINEVWNSKDKHLDEAHQIFSTNAIINSPLGKKIGRESMQNTTLNWLNAFSDIHVFDVNLAIVGNTVISEWHCTGVHDNTFQLINPTHKKITYSGTSIYCFNDNKEIISYFCNLNMLNIYEQLGFFLAREKYEQQKILYNDKNLLIEKLGNLPKFDKKLTGREIECLCFLLNGYTAKKTALKLKISYRTVEEYIRNAMMKLQCHNKNHLIELMQEESMFHLWHDLFDLIVWELKGG